MLLLRQASAAEACTSRSAHAEQQQRQKSRRSSRPPLSCRAQGARGAAPTPASPPRRADPASLLRDAPPQFRFGGKKDFSYLENAGGSQVPLVVADAVRNYMLVRRGLPAHAAGPRAATYLTFCFWGGLQLGSC